ncbi:bifunctional diguanylate cyclase/phosphodiesterase [Kangiella sp. TOML190]|uniref:putative bifunctional diguanylate cyclase/phosphodiesterase n=1 Tax=Kangiella sp. TOML190 TaxID=2931351 RepID=UPI00203D0198|nr:EAL domain-containing protein [Kangiella sp. TOML190]
MSTDEFPASRILQVQVVFLFILGGLFFSASFAVIYFFLEMYPTTLVLLSSILIGIFCLWLLRRYQKSESVAHIVLTLFFSIIIAANLELGGFDNPNDAWFMVIVMVSGLLLTHRSVWVYAGLVLMVSIAFYVFKYLGMEFPKRLSQDKLDLLNLFNRIGAVTTTVFLIILFRYERNMREQGLNEKEQKLYQLANYDQLTQLFNRTYFAQAFEQRIEDNTNQRQALLFVDLDAFKVVNDTFGHNIGDELLKEVGKRFKTQLNGDDLICRHGGDEFLVMPSSSYSEEQVENFANNLIRALNKPFHINEQKIHIGCSVGIAFYPRHGNGYMELLRASDIAMYRAKERGTEQFQVYSDNLAKEIHNKNQMALDLRRAIDKGQLSLVYQPKVNLKTKEISGYEALVRWTNEQNEVMEPSIFVAIAEEFSLVNKLGEWLINTVCKQIKEWQNQGEAIKKIAINVSAKQLLRSDFVTEIIRATNYFQLDASLIELELTESVFIESSHETLRKLNKLSDLGYSLVIDDYGTGYASLGYLKRFPVSALKIDKSFIDEILLSEQDQTIVGSTIELAHQLGLEVIAEGVENDEQLQVLKNLGCDLIQGYYFSRPLSAEQVFKQQLK